MNGKSNFASTKFRLVGVLVSVLLLTAFPLVAMVNTPAAMVNAPKSLPLNVSDIKTLGLRTRPVG